MRSQIVQQSFGLLFFFYLRVKQKALQLSFYCFLLFPSCLLFWADWQKFLPMNYLLLPRASVTRSDMLPCAHRQMFLYISVLFLYMFYFCIDAGGQHFFHMRVESKTHLGTIFHALLVKQLWSKIQFTGWIVSLSEAIYNFGSYNS